MQFPRVHLGSQTVGIRNAAQNFLPNWFTEPLLSKGVLKYLFRWLTELSSRGTCECVITWTAPTPLHSEPWPQFVGFNTRNSNLGRRRLFTRSWGLFTRSWWWASSHYHRCNARDLTKFMTSRVNALSSSLLWAWSQFFYWIMFALFPTIHFSIVLFITSSTLKYVSVLTRQDK